MKDDRLLRPAAKTASSGRRRTARRSASRWSAGRWSSATTRGSASPREHAPSQRQRVVIRHLEIPGDPTRLRDPRNRLPRDVAGLDIQHRGISDLIYGSADLAGRIRLQIQ